MISRVGVTVLVALSFGASSAQAQRPVRTRTAPFITTSSSARYQVVVQESPVGSEATKQLKVSCPAGRMALAGGWAVLDGTGAILDGNATYSEPTWDAGAWQVNAQNVSAYSATWKLRVRAICGSTDPTFGYEVAAQESAVGSEALKQLSLRCSSGKTALGAGWAVLDATGAILEGRTTYLEPAYDASGWMANAQKVSTFTPTWKLRVRELCATATSTAGYEVVVRESPLGNEATKQLQASCPTGKQALGAGWAVVDGSGATLEGRATYAEPAWDASGWTVNAQKVSTFAPTWKLRLRMVCASSS